jgi:hypothetical protein
MWSCWYRLTTAGSSAAFDDVETVRRADRSAISDSGWSDNEKEVMADHHWWSVEELQQTTDIIFPDGLLDLLKAAGVAQLS